MRTNHTLHRFTNYHHPRLYTSNPSAATITTHYPWATGLLLSDVHLSELERLDKLCARFAVDDTSHSVISSYKNAKEMKRICVKNILKI